ncbi:hypothetical protein NDU88_001348 [Pleurodeles waltl]|uniref:Uncharacterized protein n=1 Tax=Pleurodeles waltl TaxID=8319 RepID=A0AAV7RCK8_PLEWA|nr:hypothetical protein NDU88_001348 [Pleurodeles waltl]
MAGLGLHGSRLPLFVVQRTGLSARRKEQRTGLSARRKEQGQDSPREERCKDRNLREKKGAKIGISARREVLGQDSPQAGRCKDRNLCKKKERYLDRRNLARGKVPGISLSAGRRKGVGTAGIFRSGKVLGDGDSLPVGGCAHLSLPRTCIRVWIVGSDECGPGANRRNLRERKA